MGKQILKTIQEQGYCVAKNVLNIEWVSKLNSLTDLLIPQRGHDFEFKYFPRRQLDQATDLAIWWSQQVTTWNGAKEINNRLLELTADLFDEPNQVYVSDVITNEPGNQFVKPHIDSPYRFDQWHDSFELLGLQCIVPLCDFSKANGGTGIYPGSHLTNWNVQDSYKGKYTQEFMEHVYQPEMSVGDILIYNPRVLHSTMPNNTSTFNVGTGGYTFGSTITVSVNGTNQLILTLPLFMSGKLVASDLYRFSSLMESICMLLNFLGGIIKHSI
jgi:hypothetical protein